MTLIVDANNLAGALHILSAHRFQEQVIAMFKFWPNREYREIYLVFDPIDSFGDRIQAGRLTVIYPPAGPERHAADERITALAVRLAAGGPASEALTVATDDRGLREAVAIAVGNRKVIFLHSADLAKLLCPKNSVSQTAEDGSDRRLSEAEQAAISAEMISLWK
ncbi:hypothetical protein COX22_01910 [Candidatus Falkowbacteria bacterium CG23_combo_of_CG06-09_8_20_14_all_49_15]|uniref:NYN domain-containing protein n=1 Tax=Candidatus Falkowbacteria bacterium CG23_combo_of_CG06-09_8_20_14_all_49_15 TaxID=1974572 RepID=A0A2G9ZL43_9BACT|nr:MAG: hypothetical protein COX22_01910 [Candidatus Falkowbacteria bacterium CG23_combo_of_CG06-09_8_20_14_all_49_15]